MNFFIGIGLVVLLASIVPLIVIVAYSFWKKSQIETGVSIQCSSGDSEVMSFNHNFKTGESAESKASKIYESFEAIEERRDQNHAKYLELKQKAIEENERLAAQDPSILKMGKSNETQTLREANKGSK